MKGKARSSKFASLLDETDHMAAPSTKFGWVIPGRRR
jgi:hypothetical protein